MAKLFILPGMGANEKMYPGPWHALPESVFVHWPRYSGEESIDAVVWRIVAEYHINPGSILIGSSLGGMVACEIANRLDLSALVLVGSACAPSEVSRVLNVLHPLANLVPFRQLQALVDALPFEYAEMFQGAEPEFVRSMCHAIFKWEGLRKGVIRPLRIHGRKDLVIPCPPDADLLLEGRHMVAYTHAQECVDFICRKLCLNQVAVT